MCLAPHSVWTSHSFCLFSHSLTIVTCCHTSASLTWAFKIMWTQYESLISRMFIPLMSLLILDYKTTLNILLKNKKACLWSFTLHLWVLCASEDKTWFKLSIHCRFIYLLALFSCLRLGDSENRKFVPLMWWNTGKYFFFFFNLNKHSLLSVGLRQ